MLKDSYNRLINYLRISITDRCNFRCQYCMPQSGIQKMNHLDILSYEEILTIARVAAKLGVSKFRLTGGEPLVRKGVLEFIDKLNNLEGVNDIRLTTNGSLLEEMASDLLGSGVRSVNVSLDSLDRDNYARITGVDSLDQVWRGIERSLDVGFEQVKINSVAVRGMNDHELIEMVRLTKDRPLQVRFIEFMPIGRADIWNERHFISVREIKDRISEELELKPVDNNSPGMTGGTSGPARVFTIPGFQGTIGFISPMTEHFCYSCNRIRLTPDGKLRLCLLSDLEVDLKKPLRQNVTDMELSDIIKKSVSDKPISHSLQKHIESPEHTESCMNRTMNRIGG